MSKRHSWVVVIAAWPWCLSAQTASTPPHAVALAPTSGTVLAHHVRLTGTGMSQAMSQVLSAGLQRCRESGRTVEALPDHAPILHLTYDVYYTDRSVTTYKRTKTQQVTVDCTLVPHDNLEIEVLTVVGLCQISPQRGIQRGACRLSWPLPSIAARARTTRDAPIAAGQSQVAGHACHQYEEQWGHLRSRYCILPTPPATHGTEGTFVPAPATWHRHTPGVLLQLRTWSDSDPALKVLELDATQVHTALRISPSVVMPTEGTEAPRHAP